MSLLTDFLTFEYANAYVLSNSKQFSAPKIYDAGGDFTKRWYVYYSFRNPKTGKLERQTPIYGGANKYKTKTDRMEVLSMYRRSLHDFLKRGFNPYEDNSDLLTKFQSSDIHTENSSQKVVASAEIKVEDKSRTSISDAFAQVLHIKKHVVSPSTYMNYKQKLLKLEQWLKGVLPQNATIDQITKQHIVSYLNQVLERTSARTRNNTRVELGSLFQALVDNEFIPYNFIHSINVLRTRPERHKTYSIRQQQSIYTYLEKEDSTLLLFIQFISYNFLRPIEVCRLRVKDVNIKEKRLYVRAKNKPVKIKIIPDIMLSRLPSLEGLPLDNYLITPNGIGCKWAATEVNRRDYFSKRFKKVVKEHFKLGQDFGLYSFRHTFITRLYREMIKDATPFEVKSRLMLITGHSTMGALEKYLRDIDAQLPEDYSELLIDSKSN